MNKFFVPYVDSIPAAIDIKGHRLLIVATNAEDVAVNLNALGGDSIRQIDLNDSVEDQNQVLGELAASVNGGVVLAPPGIDLHTMLDSLESELPWVH